MPLGYVPRIRTQDQSWPFQEVHHCSTHTLVTYREKNVRIYTDFTPKLLMPLHCAATRNKFLNVYFFSNPVVCLSWQYVWESNITIFNVFFVFPCLLSSTLVSTSLTFYRPPKTQTQPTPFLSLPLSTKEGRAANVRFGFKKRKTNIVKLTVVPLAFISRLSLWNLY